MRYKLLYLTFLLIFLTISCNREDTILQSDDGIPPAVPTSVYVYFAGDGEIVLQWKPNVEQDFDKYNIYQSLTNTTFNFIGETRDNFFVVDSLLYSQKYFFKITAVDKSGMESVFSSVVSETPINKNPPTAPRGFQVNARNWQNVKYFNLTWFKNNESDVAGYKIYRSEQSGFAADTNSFIGFTNNMEFNDTSNFSFYKDYYYKIKAIDRGELESIGSEELNDQIFEIPEIVYPSDNSQISLINNFVIKAIQKPAEYKIIVQTNELFGEFWSTQFSSGKTSDTLQVKFTPLFIEAGIYYYWRVATYSNGNSNPNSVSKLYKFFLTSEFL